jgi:hypothetical protein
MICAPVAQPVGGLGERAAHRDARMLSFDAARTPRARIVRI